MKRMAALLLIVSATAFLVVGCGPATKTARPSPSAPGVTPTGEVRASVKVGKDTVYLTPVKTYEAAQFPQTAMTGAPSNIPFFKPTKDEGILNRDYPAFDSKTYKFLFNMSECLVPEWYYLFDKNGGTLNPAVAKSGYKFADIEDGGHLKMMPNLMLGYYDFAFVPANIVTELWSGNETQNQELWRAGDNYAVVGSSYNAGVDLLAAQDITSLKQLDGKTVGIMNVGMHSEALLNKKLATVGLATESAGGTVKVEMGTPGFIMNDMIAKKVSAAFVWTKYASELRTKHGFKTLVKWQDLGYGDRMPSVWLLARKDIIANHPEVVQAVVQANYDAAKAAAATGEYQSRNDAVYNAYWQKYYGKVPNIVDPPKELVDAQANPAFLHGVIDYMTKVHYFRIPYTYGDLVNETFYDKVKK